MTKKILTVLNLFAFITVFGQSGIGTHTPEGALDITSPNKDWGLVLPCVDQAENTKNPTGKAVKKGTIVYDLKENCIRYFNGSEWSGCIVAPIPIPFELNCSAAVLNQDIVANYPIGGGTTISVPYSNTGDEFAYNGITIESSNVIGLTAVVSSGSIKKGAGNLVFSITGTPSASGKAKFSLSMAGISCEFVVIAKNYTDIKAPAITNLTCDSNNQLNYTTLKGKHIINGKEVTVDYDGSNIRTYTAWTSCGVLLPNNNIYLGGANAGESTFTITFSHPVTNVGIAFAAADVGEIFTFTVNNKQPIQLNNTSSCQGNINIIDNKVNIITAVSGGNITAGGKWFTELTINHNGSGGGAFFGICLNNTDAL